MSRFIIVLSAILILAPAVRAADLVAGELTIGQPWARATAVTATAGAIYVSIANRGSEADRLLSAEVAIAERVELHAHQKGEDGVMRMTQVGEIVVSAGGKVELQPGGLHLMLFGLKEPLRLAAKIPVTLVFARAGRVAATAVVGPIAALTAAEAAGDCCATPAAKTDEGRAGTIPVATPVPEKR